MTDKNIVSRRFSRAAASYSDNALVQNEVADRMLSMIADVVPVPGTLRRVFEIGCGPGTFTLRFLSRYAPEFMLLNDICGEYGKVIEAALPEGVYGSSVHFVPGDAEAAEFPGGFDLIASCSAVQWFHDLPAFVRKAAGALSENGIVSISTFGKDNFREIAEIEGRTLEYYRAEEIESMFSPFFDMIRIEESLETLYFDTHLELLRHLKDTGVAGTGSGFWTRGRLDAFGQRYEEFRTSRGIPLTFHPIWLTARVKKHLK